MRVFQQPWLDIVAPTPAEFDDAYRARTATLESHRAALNETGPTTRTHGIYWGDSPNHSDLR